MAISYIYGKKKKKVTFIFLYKGQESLMEKNKRTFDRFSVGKW